MFRKKIAKQLAPFERVGHFWVKLQAIDGPRAMLHGGEATIVCAGELLEVFGNVGYLVTVAHPDLANGSDILKQGVGLVDAATPLGHIRAKENSRPYPLGHDKQAAFRSRYPGWEYPGRTARDRTEGPPRRRHSRGRRKRSTPKVLTRGPARL